MREEKIIVGEGTKYPLNGLLTLPDDVSKSVPAVVFVHGSGSSNMDEKVGKLTPFKDLAHGLARYNIASIRYDKRTYKHALKMMKDKDNPITVKEETIEDAILAAELLRHDSRIDSDRLFIVGHSMGGMLAPRIDLDGGDFRGLIIMAGTPRKLDEIMIEQTCESLNSMNKVLKFLLKGTINKLLQSLDGIYELSDEEAKKVKIGNGVTAYYFKMMGDVPSYLNKVNKPMLIMQGAKDFQVKADVDYKMYQDLLKDRDNVTFKFYENLNHCFVNSTFEDINDAKKEYNIEQHIGHDVILDIVNFIKEA